MRRHTVLYAAALLASTLPLTAARAADQVITATANTFNPADVSLAQGNRLTFANTDIAPHNVVSDARTRTGPLFASATVPAGGTAEVDGVASLKPGTYPFYCSVHPSMRGTVTVTGGAVPAVIPVATGASVPSPTSLTVRNGAVYVTSYLAGTVTALPILPGGALGASTVYAQGLESPLGLVFAPDGMLYVADSHPGPAGRRVGRVWAVKPDGTKTTVIDGLPNGRHNTNGLAVRGGRLYVANGNATDDGVSDTTPELPLNGTVLSYALPVTTRSKPTVESRGLRNPYDIAFRPGTTELWFATNGPDAMDPYGEDLLHKVDVRSATIDYGFPACVYKAGLVRGHNPAVSTKCTAKFALPELALGLHVSADGLAFGTGGAWGNDLFIAEFGSNAPPPTGHKVIRVPMANGRAGTPTDLYVGATPIDVAFGPDGLYVADFGTGQITLLRAVG